MKQYDAENQADDQRNSKMSDLAQDNDVMRIALHDIVEIYAGLEGFRAVTITEEYMHLRLRETYLTASKALKRTT